MRSMLTASSACDSFTVKLGRGPLIAVAVHNGHDIRPQVDELLSIDSLSRLREEDPYTGLWTRIVPTSVVGMRSRFEFDLNRPREKAIYLTPDDAWGLNVWRRPLNRDMLQVSMAEYDRFYESMASIINSKVTDYGRVVILDLHTYNYRRTGPKGELAESVDNPDINVGTGTMDQTQWSSLVSRFIRDARDYDFLGRRLDVRENVRFRGGQLSRWAHTHYPDSVCSLSIEVKKFFIDEWTGDLDPVQWLAIRELLRSTIPGIYESLESLNA